MNRFILSSRCMKVRNFKKFSSTSTVTINNEVFQMGIDSSLPITNKLEIKDTKLFDKWPVFRILDPNGKIVPNAIEPVIDEITAKKMYQLMVRLQALDEVMVNSQRQGRISFYMQCSGEEAIHIGNFIKNHC